MTLALIARNCLLVATSLVLSACMHVPVTTLYKLWSFDMATADPAVLRAATRVPAFLAARANGVTMNFTSWRDGEKDKRVHAFILSEVQDASELAGLAKFKRSGDTITAYRLAPADVHAVRKLQAEHLDPALSIKGQVHSEISVSADVCHN